MSKEKPNKIKNISEIVNEYGFEINEVKKMLSEGVEAYVLQDLFETVYFAGLNNISCEEITFLYKLNNDCIDEFISFIGAFQKQRISSEKKLYH